MRIKNPEKGNPAQENRSKHSHEHDVNQKIIQTLLSETATVKEKNDAITEAYQRYYKYVITVIKNIIKEEVSSHDIAQKVFYEVFVKKAEMLKEHGLVPIKKQLCVTAYSRAIDALRKEYGRHKRKKIHSLHGLSEQEKNNALKDERLPSEKVEYDELHYHVSKVIENLNERDHKIFILYYEEEKTLKEIGEEFSLSEGGTGQILRKIKKSIADHLVKQGLISKDQAEFLLTPSNAKKTPSSK